MNLALDKDIYFDSRFGKINADLVNGEYREFLFEHALGTIRHHYVIRRIESQLSDGEMIFDLTSPYGYGGPLILECKEGKEEELVDNFMESFRLYCANQNVVSEFIRFHPIANNAKYFSKHYSIEFHNYTVGTNLVDYKDPFLSEFSRSCRRDIRRSLRAGLSVEIEERPKTLDDFVEIYYDTMNRLKADKFYYFSKHYFEDLLQIFPENILKGIVKFENKAIAMGLFFKTEDMLHDHLSGSLTEFMHFAPTYVLHYGFLLWGIEHGIKLIHYGGGTGRSENDSLLAFKKQFGQNTRFSFNIGKKIWDKERYERLTAQISDIAGFFPAYRTH